jgi:hypothetical protein
MFISIADMYGAAVEPKNALCFRIFALPAISRKKREEQSFVFKCDTAEDAARWVDVIKHVVAGVPLSGLVY